MPDSPDQETPSMTRSPWAQSFEDLAEATGISLERGLSGEAVRRRRRRYGTNRIRERKRRGAGAIFIDQFKSPIPFLLIVAAVASFVFSQWIEGAAITAALLINVTIGFFTELRATHSMEALRSLSQSSSRVVRDGKDQEISSTELVPGDLVLLEAGDLVGADLRLAEENELEINESALTGESDAVQKDPAPVADEAPLADRGNMVFKGTFVVKGSARGLVVATGMETELGRIAAMAEQAEPEMSPLERRLNALGKRLVWVVLVIAALVTVSGLLTGTDPVLILKTAVALAIAAIPEGLPIVATVALARGMWRMAKRNAVVNRLSSVETLGSTTTICTDKTGTLTENRMRATEILYASGSEPALERAIANEECEANGGPVMRAAIEVAVLCNNAVLDGDDEQGVPEETALLRLARQAGVREEEIKQAYPKVDEDPFDSQKKRMSTFHRAEKGVRVAVKGAPEVLLESCDTFRTSEGTDQAMDEAHRRAWREHVEARASEGLRMLALAETSVSERSEFKGDHLTLLGVVGLQDPPRAGIAEEIDKLQRAGLRVVMVTGDQRETAMSIADQIGLLTNGDRQSVYARISPEDKLNLVAELQEEGDIVAMTGDGVNDAPALEKADIGVAMGRRGTQVAQEAADIILRDDAFRTIAAAVEQGRIIFNNIRKFVLFLLSG